MPSSIRVQGVQLKMAVFGTRLRATCPVNVHMYRNVLLSCVHVAYTGQVTIYKVPEKHGHD